MESIFHGPIFFSERQAIGKASVLEVFIRNEIERWNNLPRELNAAESKQGVTVSIETRSEELHYFLYQDESMRTGHSKKKSISPGCCCRVEPIFRTKRKTSVKISLSSSKPLAARSQRLTFLPHLHFWTLLIYAPSTSSRIPTYFQQVGVLCRTSGLP